MAVIVPVMARWGDQDPYGHVNNAQIVRILEEARVRSMWSVGGSPGIITNIDASPGSDTITVVARHEINYLRPIMYQCDPLQVEISILRLGGASLDVYCEIWPDDDRSDRPSVKATTTLVFINTETGRPRSMTKPEREQFSRYLVESP